MIPYRRITQVSDLHLSASRAYYQDIWAFGGPISVVFSNPTLIAPSRFWSASGCSIMLTSGRTRCRADNASASALRARLCKSRNFCLWTIRATGAGWWQVLTYAILPQIAPRLIGLSWYRIDINFRESAVVGIVGAGGIGATLNTAR